MCSPQLCGQFPPLWSISSLVWDTIISNLEIISNIELVRYKSRNSTGELAAAAAARWLFRCGTMTLRENFCDLLSLKFYPCVVRSSVVNFLVSVEYDYI